MLAPLEKHDRRDENRDRPADACAGARHPTLAPSDSAAAEDLALPQTSTTRHSLVGQKGAAGLLKRGLSFVKATQRVARRKLLYQDLPRTSHALRVKSGAVQGAQLIVAGMVQLNDCASR
jgi:hypothetical protein